MIAKNRGGCKCNGETRAGERVRVRNLDPFSLTLTFSLLRINQINGMAFITSLRARMGLMALIAGLHGGAVGPGRTLIMFNVAMAIDAEAPFSAWSLWEKYSPDSLRAGLFPSGDGGMAARAVLVHQLIAGRKLAGNQLSRGGMTFHTGHRCRMAAGGEPHLRNFLVVMTAQAEKGVAGGKANQAQSRDGRQDQQDRNDQRPGALGQFGDFGIFGIFMPTLTTCLEVLFSSLG